MTPALPLPIRSHSRRTPQNIYGLEDFRIVLELLEQYDLDQLQPDEIRLKEKTKKIIAAIKAKREQNDKRRVHHLSTTNGS